LKKTSFITDGVGKRKREDTTESNKKAKVEAKNGLEQMLYNAKAQIGEKVPAVNEWLDQQLEWLEEHGNELSTDLSTPDQAGWPTNNSQGTTFSGNFKITENCSGLKVYFKEPVNLIEIRSCQNMFSKRFLSPFHHCSSKNSRCYTTGCEHLNQVILAIARGDPSSKEILHCPSSFHS